MRTIYIDNEFCCFLTSGENRREIDTDAFDGKCDAFIEGYRYVPEGESWTRSDGVSFTGKMLCPAIDYNGLDAAQRQNEQAALEYIGIVGKEAPLEMAEVFRTAIDTVIADIDDASAIDISVLFPQWSGMGMQYTDGDRVSYQEVLYKCLQSHLSQADWAPGVASSLWVVVSNPEEEWPEWVQPTGAHDAYALGAKVKHNNNRYVSKINANTTVPGSDERWWALQA